MSDVVKKIADAANSGLISPTDMFAQLRSVAAAKTFVEENKDQLGDYLSQAQALVSGSEGLDGLVDKVKGLF